MKGLCGPHKNIVAAVRRVQMEHGEHLLELIGDAVGVLFGLDALTVCDALDVDAVLVRARQEKLLKAALTFVARQRIGNDGRVETAKMRFPVDVVNRRGDVEGFHSPLKKILDFRLPILDWSGARTLNSFALGLVNPKSKI